MIASVLLAALLLAAPGRALASPRQDAKADTQDTGTAGDSPDASTGSDPATSRKGPLDAFTSEIAITLDSFGVGNMGREGEWTGIRLKLRDTSTAQRDVLVRVSIADSDGDTPSQQRKITTNPGRDDLVWLYLRLPYTDFSRVPLRVTVHEAVGEGDAASPEEDKYRPGQLLGRTEIEPNQGQVIPAVVGHIAVVGPRTLGLRQFYQRMSQGAPWSDFGQELTEVTPGIRPVDLPDRWVGLAGCEAVVWGQGEISELRGERARAVRDYVERGGHLVIVLPNVGQTWTTPASNEIIDLLPAAIIHTDELAEYASLRPLLTGNKDAVRFPLKGVLHTFEARGDAEKNEAMPVLAAPDGRCIVMRRLVGAGMVTVIGIDLNMTALAQGDGLIDADVFWQRVLGRRGDLTPLDVKGGGAPSIMGDYRPWYSDNGLQQGFALEGSGMGALLGFAVFALYWVAVGPPGYLLLKKHNLHKYAWLFFLAGSLVFTVIAWGGATLARPMNVTARTLTVVDHVYGQPVDRARVWASVLVPRYGTSRISVGDASGINERSLSTLAPWGPPEEDGDGGFSFPDARQYAVDTRAPDAMNVPVRATVKAVQADWCAEPSWGMPHPQDANADGLAALMLTKDWTDASSQPLISGSLVHELPAPLEHVHVIVVRGQRRVTGTPTDQLIASADIFAMTDPWAPGTPLGIDTLRKVTTGNTSLHAFLNTLSPGDQTGGMGQIAVADRLPIEGRLMALSFFHHLPQPSKPQGGMAGIATTGAAPLRRSTQTLDMSRWLTQPCVIVLGFVKQEKADDKGVVPLYVDGKRVACSGLTMVRWVYPLDPAPPVIVKLDEQVGRKPKNKPAESDGGLVPSGSQ